MSDDVNGLDIAAILEWPELKDVKDELDDPRFSGRSHGSRATYAKKCHGPLCSKAERDRGRNRNQKRAGDSGRPYQASIHRKYDRDDLLEAIIVWHKRAKALARLERAS